jgi:hypothetical protein
MNADDATFIPMAIPVLEADSPPNGSAAESHPNPRARPKSKKKRTVQELLASLRVELKPGRSIPIEDLAGEPDRSEDRQKFESLVTNLLLIRAVLEPLVVRYDPEGGKYRIVAGRRRLAAALEARRRHGEKHKGEPPIFTELPCVELVGPPDVATDVLIAIVENDQRLDEKPLDTARKLKQVKQATKLKDAEIAGLHGISPGTASEMLYAVEMPEEWVRRIEDGENLFKVVREHKTWVKQGGEGASNAAGSQEVTAGGSGDPGTDKGSSGPPSKDGTQRTRPPIEYPDLAWPDDDAGLEFAVRGKGRKTPKLARVIRGVENWLGALKARAEAESGAT